MRSDAVSQEMHLQDLVAQHYEDIRYRRPHSRTYHFWWTAEMIKAAPDSGLWLDLGCGTGWNQTVLAALDSKRGSVGIDLSEGMLRFAREKGLTVVRGDAQRLPFHSDAFDGILAKGVLHHLPDLELAVAEIKRVLKPNGVAVLVDPNPSPLRKLQALQRNREQHFSHLHRSIQPGQYLSIVSKHLQIEAFQYFGLLAYPLAFPDILPFRSFSGFVHTLIKPLITCDSRLSKIPLLHKLCWAYLVVGKKRPTGEAV